jgi:hypothetical protein
LSLNFCFLTNSSKRVYDVQKKHLKKGKCCEAVAACGVVLRVDDECSMIETENVNTPVYEE